MYEKVAFALACRLQANLWSKESYFNLKKKKKPTASLQNKAFPGLSKQSFPAVLSIVSVYKKKL